MEFFPQIYSSAGSQVRATEITKNAVQKAQLPPNPFPTDRLSGEAQKPSLDELKTVLDFDYVVKCMEHIYQDNHSDTFDLKTSFEQIGGPIIAQRWKEGFYRSVYRVFLAGAVLYRAYQEPLSRAADEGPPNFLEKFVEYIKSGVGGGVTLTAGEIKYLFKFPVFNFEAWEGHEAPFGPLAELFVSESEKRALLERKQDLPGLDRRPDILAESCPFDITQASVLYNETVQFLLACEVFCGSEWTRISLFLRDEIDCEEYAHTLQFDGIKEDARTRKIQVFPFGHFFLQEISMPDSVVKPVFPNLTTSANLEFPHMQSLLYEMNGTSGQPNHYDTNSPSALPPLQFVQYVFRKYLGIRFADDCFTGRHPSLGAYSDFGNDREPFCGRWESRTTECLRLDYADRPPANPFFKSILDIT